MSERSVTTFTRNTNYAPHLQKSGVALVEDVEHVSQIADLLRRQSLERARCDHHVVQLLRVDCVRRQDIY